MVELTEQQLEYLSNRVNKIRQYACGYFDGANVERQRQIPLLDKLRSLEHLFLKMSTGQTFEETLGVETADE
jgi:hypothetical protein